MRPEVPKITKLILLAVTILCSRAAALQTRDSSYANEINAWRTDHEAQLKADNGWLTVSGLFWLKEGQNSVGSSSDNSIVVPPTAPARIGNFQMVQGKTTLRLAEGVQATFQGKPFQEIELAATSEKASPPVIIGDLTFLLLKRGSRYAIRLKDNNSPSRKEFTGLRWYPVNESFRVTAVFERFDKPRDLPITNVLGDIENYKSPGVFHFKLRGQEYSLQPGIDGEKLMIVFNDLTTGKSTYPGGRFLYLEKNIGKTVILDFNRAENPPCAFSEFTTCPLPPKPNRLKVAIEAGEMNYQGHSKPQ